MFLLFFCRTGLRNRYHPQEKDFHHIVDKLRSEGFHEKNKTKTWMHFEMSKRAKRDFWYDFATGEESEELPSSAQELAPLPQALMPEYKTEIVPQTNVREIIKNVKVLSFKSWWYEVSSDRLF